MSAFALWFAVAALAEDPTATPSAPPTESATEAEAPAPVRPDCTGLADDPLKRCQNEVALFDARASLAALGDCSVRTGDEKTKCEAKKVDLERRVASLDPATRSESPKPSKGAKAKRSNSNRLEAEDSDE